MNAITSCFLIDYEARAEHLVSQFVKRWNRLSKAAIKRPQVVFYPRGTAAGRATIDGLEIAFHSGLMQRCWEEYEREVIAHEVAHAIAYQTHGQRIRPHGPEWRLIGQRLGFQLEVNHRLDVSGLKARRTRHVELISNSGEIIWITASYYTRITRRGGKILSKASGQRLKPTGRERLK